MLSKCRFQPEFLPGKCFLGSNQWETLRSTRKIFHGDLVDDTSYFYLIEIPLTSKLQIYTISANKNNQGGGAKRRPFGAPPKAAPVVFQVCCRILQYVWLFFEYASIVCCFFVVHVPLIFLRCSEQNVPNKKDRTVYGNSIDAVHKKGIMGPRKVVPKSHVRI